MMKSSIHEIKFEKDLSEIISIIKKTNPEKIYLFGSRTTGASNEQSDIDLIIVAPSNERPLESAFRFWSNSRCLFPLTWREYPGTTLPLKYSPIEPEP